MKQSTFISAKDVCDDLSISRDQLNILLRRGQFPKPVVMTPAKNAKRLFRRDDVNAYKRKLLQPGVRNA